MDDDHAGETPEIMNDLLLGGINQLVLSGLIVGDDVRPTPAPDLRVLGTAGAWYFRNQPTRWVARHVETLEILGARSGVRRLTVDIKLPHDPKAAIADAGDTLLYCLPIARLAKEHPVSFIDLHDEEERTLPLFTRAENGVISRRALTVVVSDLLGNQAVDAALGYGLDVVVGEEGMPAEIGAGIFKEAARLHRQLGDGPVGERLTQVVLDLQNNSIVWLPLRGRPGERRVMKLSYRIPLRVPVVPARKTEIWHVDELDIDLKEEGKVDWLETSRNLAARFTAAMGWDAIDIVLEPVVQDPVTYHFQGRMPSGLRLEEIRQLSVPYGEVYNKPPHLYLRSGEPGQDMPLLLRVRMHRRGLLNLSLLAGVVITLLLWCAQSKVAEFDGTGDGDGTRAQIAAAVLLVIPALLVLFANRPAENPLASALLTGVRWCAVFAGLSAAAAAAALSGIRAMSLEASMTVYAVVASAATAAILVAWTGSVTFFRERAVESRRAWWGDTRHAARGLVAATIAVATVGLLGRALADNWIRCYDHGARSAVVVGIVGLVGVLAVGALRRSAAGSDKGDKTSGLRDANLEPTDVGDLEALDGDTIEGGAGAGLVPVPWATTGAVVVTVVGAVLLLVGLNRESDALFGPVAWGCFAAAGLCLIGVVTTGLWPLPQPPDPSLYWDPWEAAMNVLKTVELLDHPAADDPAVDDDGTALVVEADPHAEDTRRNASSGSEPS